MKTRKYREIVPVLLNRTIYALVAAVVLPGALSAQTKPVQISLFNPVQIVAEDEAIAGVRLNLIYGRNTSVVGFDIGLVNHSTDGHSKGLQAGIVGFVEHKLETTVHEVHHGAVLGVVAVQITRIAH